MSRYLYELTNEKKKSRRSNGKREKTRKRERSFLLRGYATGNYESLENLNLEGPCYFQAMFVSQKVVSGKPLSKLSCVCLPLEKVVNEKHFPVNIKHFTVKEKFDLVSRKVFSLLTVFVFRKVVSGKTLSKLSCVCLPLEKLVNGKHFSVKGKFDLVFRKVFPWKI